MAFHVKSIDWKHLLGTGVEGFYGPSTPDRLQFNPNTFAGQVGTDFIKNHQVLGVDYASAHMYPDSWLVSHTPIEKCRQEISAYFLYGAWSSKSLVFAGCQIQYLKHTSNL